MPAKFASQAATRLRKSAPSLMEMSYQRIRADILTCRLRPGGELSESDLAEALEMSKTPVREALGRLSAEGFVTVIPRRGYQVTPLTTHDMTELFDMRGIVEVGLVPMVIDRITREQLDELEQLAVASYDRDALSTIDNFVAANKAFHLAIAATSSNARLMKLAEQQMDELQRYFYIGAQNRDVSPEVNNEHMQIVNALRARDVEGTRKALTAHNERTRLDIFQTLLTSRSSSFLQIS